MRKTYIVQVDAYDSLLVGYQKAAVNTETIASVLNAGQGVILSVGLTGVLALAAATSGVGSFTAGDLVSHHSSKQNKSSEILTEESHLWFIRHGAHLGAAPGVVIGAPLEPVEVNEKKIHCFDFDLGL